MPFERAPLGGAWTVLIDPRDVRPGDRAILEAASLDGWPALGVGWTGGALVPGPVDVEGLRIDTLWCAHPPGTPIC